MNANLFESEILAIIPDRIAGVIEARKLALQLDIQSAINRTPTKYGVIDGKIAVIPVYGFINSRATLWSMMGLESSSEIIASQVQQAANDPSIGAIILDIDSPGGTVKGLTSASEKIFAQRGKKPLMAISNGMMASAAYFLGSSADEIVSDPDSETGSIGSVMLHADYTEYLKNEGIKTTVIRSDEKKFRGSPYESLDDETMKEFQDEVNRYAYMFISKVALHRGVQESVVREKFGKGGVLSPLEAKSVGMIDKIGTMDSVLAKMTGVQNISRGKARAIAEIAKIRSMFRR